MRLAQSWIRSISARAMSTGDDETSGMITDATYAAHEILADARDIDGMESDPAVRKRMYNRQKLRDMRREQRGELGRLHAEVQECTRRILEHPRLLPWKEVADELRQDLGVAQVRNQDLKQAAARLRHVLQVLVPWTQAMPCGVVRFLHLYLPVRLTCTRKASLLPHQSDWRHNALLGATGDVRGLSYKWITERLYHNTDMALAQYERGNEGMVSLVESRDDAMSYVVIRDQRIVSASLAQVTEAHRRIYCRVPLTTRLDHKVIVDAFGDEEENIVHRFVGAGEPSEVSRLFEGETRSVLVATNIGVDDSSENAAVVGDGPRRHNTQQGWIVNDRLSDNVTRVREFWTLGFPALPSLQAYAVAMGMDPHGMEIDDVYAAYTRRQESALREMLQHCRGLFYDALRGVQADQPHPSPNLASFYAILPVVTRRS
ncbi:Aste57867_17870 [Aphanomyces stellatus]|uniref:Aste57867_17870 protein n=1 Tax=Aphanomyces stellatus TaxID=120398 RepID=A0A485L8W1_9STRA|nr:hypothetical protein As57867_017809 [Aphanomyces stellatus]VFT94613.1 Aste57867_17870 [Aphanomyces stellatus]